MSLLVVRGLTRRFGGLTAVNNVDLHLDAGEILGLMGANGAGKTTLFSMLAGNQAPSAGTIELDGKPIQGMPPERVNRLGIARTFQIVRPFANLTVLDNLMVGALYGRERHRSQREASQACLQILEETGLADRAGHLAGQLNLAGRKRLEIARALATGPRILLLDEVLAGLNATEVGEALDLIDALRQRRGLSLIVIEHVMRALMRLSDRIVVLHQGCKLTEGSPDTVTRDPRVIQAYLGEKPHDAAA